MNDRTQQLLHMDLSDQIDGTKQIFQLNNKLGNNYTVLYNGIRLNKNTDFLIDGNDIILYTTELPLPGERLVIDYIESNRPNVIRFLNLKEHLNGRRTEFPLPEDFTNYIYYVYYNGVRQIEGDYFTIEKDKLTLLFSNPPKSTDNLVIDYISAKQICFGCNRINITMPLTIDQIIEQISSYMPDGIVKVDKDANNHVFLVSTTKGADAFIKVSGEAAGPIFLGTNDGVATAQGENPKTGTIDYTPLIDELKSRMGVPIAMFELTEEMVKSGLREALNLYYKWRNFKTRSITLKLNGDPVNGYEIPPIIPDQKAIREILFRPRMPFSIFENAGFESTVWSQQMLTQYNTTKFLTGGFPADFYILNMAAGDWDYILGTRPTWSIINDRIHVFPKLPSYTEVAILYDGYLSLQEIMLDSFVLKWMTGYCMELVGRIRDQFGGVLQAGETSLNMNGKELMSMGIEKQKEALDEIKKESEPPQLIFG